MGGSMGKRKKRQAAKRRGLTGEQRLRRRARVRAELVYDPATEPALAAEILREQFREGPVDLAVSSDMHARIGLDGLRAVAEAALAAARDPVALSLAADVAVLSGLPDQAEEPLARALELVDDPDLRVRLALARASQGRLADAIDVLDVPLRANPGLERLQFARGHLLEDGESDLAGRFLDRGPLDELVAAVRRFAGPADGVRDWLEAGAITEDETADPEDRRLRMIAEWAWLMPGPDDEPPPLESFAASEDQPAELRRRAEDWVSWAMWGLWEVGRPAGTPGVALTDLFTGVRMYAEVPRELLAGVPRWSVLFGYLVPVDGVWRAGSGLEVLTPLEARIAVHELLDEVMANGDAFGRPGRPMVAWARRVHDELGDLWLPDASELPSEEAVAGLQLAVRLFAPGVLAGVRELRGEIEPDADDGSYGLTLDDPEAAWRALAARPDFELEEEELVWLQDGDEEEDHAVERAYLEREEAGEIVVLAEADEVEALLEVLRGLGHPATAQVRPLELDPPEPPVALPDLPEADLPGWLEAWPDEPEEALDGAAPREAVEEGAGAAVEMLVRYLENEADRGGVDLDTSALRTELGLEKQ
jgi:tetratricopeptide (TPR) repeat protein